MKQLFAALVLLLSINLCAKAQTKTNTQTDTLSVRGNCGMCKERIENAAYIKGVKNAEWNKKTQILTVVYNPKKTSSKKIAEAVLKAGHDNRFGKAQDKDYKTLPSCCAYRTGSCDHD